MSSALFRRQMNWPNVWPYFQRPWSFSPYDLTTLDSEIQRLVPEEDPEDVAKLDQEVENILQGKPKLFSGAAYGYVNTLYTLCAEVESKSKTLFGERGFMVACRLFGMVCFVEEMHFAIAGIQWHVDLALRKPMSRYFRVIYEEADANDDLLKDYRATMDEFMLESPQFMSAYAELVMDFEKKQQSNASFGYVSINMKKYINRLNWIANEFLNYTKSLAFPLNPENMHDLQFDPTILTVPPPQAPLPANLMTSLTLSELQICLSQVIKACKRFVQFIEIEKNCPRGALLLPVDSHLQNGMAPNPANIVVQWPSNMQELNRPIAVYGNAPRGRLVTQRDLPAQPNLPRVQQLPVNRPIPAVYGNVHGEQPLTWPIPTVRGNVYWEQSATQPMLPFNRQQPIVAVYGDPHGAWR